MPLSVNFFVAFVANPLEVSLIHLADIASLHLELHSTLTLCSISFEHTPVIFVLGRGAVSLIQPSRHYGKNNFELHPN